MLRLKATRLYETSTQLSCAVTPITGCRALEISLSVHAEVFDDWSRDRTSDVTLTVPALFTHYRSVQTTIPRRSSDGSKGRQGGIGPSFGLPPLLWPPFELHPSI